MSSHIASSILPLFDAICETQPCPDSFEDFLAARGVDRSWRSADIMKNFTGLSTHQVPLLMLPNKERTYYHPPEEDNKWSMIDKPYIHRHGPYFLDITYNQGQLYSVDCFGNVSLVELGGMTLFVVSPTSKCVGCRHVTDEFRAFEVPFGNGNWLDSEVKTLGNRSLFLGTNSSFAVDATKYSGCKANCIYFISDFYEHTRKDMGVFDMTNEKMEPLATWRNPLFYISTFVD
ncbi:hypothetical protein M0R45_006336 [Rubus argutus]|uniref:KIB1-4 beta-propeller domain-containing protein n=1 Tax=Rubus argutus TaxID=59490 RepID=A0AAW1YQ99_RUBAR